jgi:pimeloyl-ACP methyl ester carboxylesterase
MIQKILKSAIKVTAFSLGALAASAIVLGNKRLDAWETLTPDDADDGDFVTLPDGVRMHYITRGTHGEPVILIHGLIGSTHEWSQNIDALAETHRVFAIDMIGFGFSSRVTEARYSLRLTACWLREFLDSQGIERAHIVGHSLGGAAALQFAHDYPDRTNKLILIAPAIYMVNLPTIVNKVARLPYVPRALVGLAMTTKRARTFAWRRALGDPARWNHHDFETQLRTVRVQGTADSLVAMLASEASSDVPGELDRIIQPTLVIWGDQDLAVPISHSTRLARDLPHAELVILEGAGHVLMVEHPDTVNRLMLDFLDGIRS